MGTITQAMLKELLTLDESTGVFYWENPAGGKAKKGKVAGCLVKKMGRWRIKIGYKGYGRSQLVFLYVYGWLPSAVDHRNHDALDDCPSNLRAATRSQNNANRRPYKRIVDLPKGVYFRGRERAKPYQSQISINGRLKHLGCFTDPAIAHAAYAKAAIEHFGEFAFLGSSEPQQSQLLTRV
jgi:hypothetical protein